LALLCPQKKKKVKEEKRTGKKKGKVKEKMWETDKQKKEDQDRRESLKRTRFSPNMGSPEHARN